MKTENKIIERNNMIILDVKLDNFYGFKNFHMNLTYPKKIVNSYIENEYLENHPNFRYKKINIIMGANATGKTTYGRMIMNIFNFIDKKNYMFITDAICDKTKEAFFRIDLADKNDILYRITCKVLPRKGERYLSEDIDLYVKYIKIGEKDSYESTVRRLEEKKQSKEENYISELEKIGELYWLFEYPEDAERKLKFPTNDFKFPKILENILKTLDPSIRKVEKLKDVNDAYIIFLKEKKIIIQNDEIFRTELLSSGTKEGVEIARVLSSLLQGLNSFYYCDEKFSYIHSDIEKAVLSFMIASIKSNEQLFFTTHNTDILEMNLPKHTFSFFKKDYNSEECSIICLNASDFLKRSTDSLRNAVENDLFSIAPLTNLIYEIADI